MKHTKNILFIAALIWATPLLHAGDLEHWLRKFPVSCGLQPVEVTEHWVNPAGGTGVNWTLRTNASNAIIPGFPGCATPATSPGFQSVMRGMATWNTVTIPTNPCSSPSFTATVSTFSFSGTPAISTTLNVNALDGMNVVTAFQSSGWWAGQGGLAVLAVARVSVTMTPSPLPPGQIFDGDIALNAETLVGPTQRGYGWFELNDSVPGLTGENLVNEFAPSEGFVDIQGAIAHEAGHVAGLGHSVVDSEAGPGGSAFPTMFPIAQGQPFAVGAGAFGTGCSITSEVAVSGTGTTFGGILGMSARTLELDDQAAIGRGYPTPAFSTALGTISGTVRSSSSVPQELLGLSVTAIGATCADTSRIGTFAYTNPSGQYTLSGLPPGTYFVSVEFVDHSPAGPPSSYFASQDVPNILGPVIFPPPPGTPCLPANIRDGSGVASPKIFREIFNTSDQKNELTQLATAVTVVAGQVLTGVDFDVRVSPTEPPPNAKLDVGPTGFGPFSMRGTQVRVGTPLDVRVNWDAAHVGWNVTLRSSTDLVNQRIAGQLREVAIVGGTGIPGTVTGTLDASGAFVQPFTATSARLFSNIWIQAELTPPGGGSPVFSNPVNIWVNLP